MASYEFTATNVNFVTAESDNYFTAHDAVTGTLASSNPNIGQDYNSGAFYDYRIRRAFIIFNTSGLDDTALIKSATLKLTETNDQSATDFDIIIKSGMPTYPHKPVVAADYELALYDGNGGSKNTSEAAGNSKPFNITLNYTGLSWINKTGDTKFALVSSIDVARSAPTEFEYFNVSNIVKIDVEYYIPTGIPVVGDPTYSGTKATYTKATATVSDAGGGYEERGFEYGISETPTWAVRETGVWGATGNYSLVLPDLLPLTTYYARAYVTNSYGTGYSDWTSFTTTDVPSYGLYEESNPPTICFYISEDDGHTWGQKHGPYTTDQADIAITKLLVRGSGKKKIKFTSDVLTGLSASVMCKVDVKIR